MKSQASTGGVLLKNVSLQILQNSQEIICTRASFFISCRVEALQNYQKETPAQVLSCEVCEIFKDIFFYRTPPVAASI